MLGLPGWWIWSSKKINHWKVNVAGGWSRGGTIHHISYDTIRYDIAVKIYDTIRYDTLFYDTIRYDTIRYDIFLRYDTIRYDIFPTIRYDTDTFSYDTIRYFFTILTILMIFETELKGQLQAEIENSEFKDF